MAQDFAVLCIDDELELGAAIVEYLAASGIGATHVTTIDDARPLIQHARLVLLDINLPDGTGFTLCREIREQADIPIIFISARGSDDDQILGLTIGADDYLVKPFSLGLLTAKVKRMLDREQPPTAAFDDGWLRVDPASGRTWINGTEAQLQTLEDRLLQLFVRERGRLITKQDLAEEVWGDPFTSDGSVNVLIRRLRMRIERDPNAPRYIRTVWGRGYLFESPDASAPGPLNAPAPHASRS